MLRWLEPVSFWKTGRAQALDAPKRACAPYFSVFVSPARSSPFFSPYPLLPQLVLVRDFESHDSAKLYPYQGLRRSATLTGDSAAAAKRDSKEAAKKGEKRAAAAAKPRARATSAAGDWVRRNLASMQSRGLSALRKVGATEFEEISRVGNSAFLRPKTPPPPVFPDPSIYLQDLELSEHECYNQSCVRAPALYVTDGEGIIPGVLELTLDMVSFKPDEVPLVRELGADRFSWALEMIDLLPPRTQVDAPSFEGPRRLMPEGPFHREDPKAQVVAQTAAAGGSFHFDADDLDAQEPAAGDSDAEAEIEDAEGGDEAAKAAAQAAKAAKAAARKVQAAHDAADALASPSTPLSPHGNLGTGPVRRVRRPSETLEEEDYPYYLELRLQLIFGRKPTAKTTASYWLALSRGRIDAVYDFLSAHCSAAQMNKEWEVVDTLDMYVEPGGGRGTGGV